MEDSEETGVRKTREHRTTYVVGDEKIQQEIQQT